MKTALRGSLWLALAALVLIMAVPALADQDVLTAEKQQNPWDENRLPIGPSEGGGGPAVVPEPSTLALLGLGLAALGAARRRRNRK